MITRLFGVAVRLYPRDHRATFGAEMAFVFEQAWADARARGVLTVITFGLRECIGLIVQACRLHFSARGDRGESWLRSLEAPVVVGVLYAVGVAAAQELGVWGFFFPVTYVVAIVLVATAAWIAGRSPSTPGGLPRARSLGLATVLFVLVMAWSVRATEDAWARRVLSQHTRVAFTIPGIQVSSEDGVAPPPRVPGLTFSRVVGNDRGNALTLLHHRDHSSPPYLAVGGLCAALAAFISRRRAVL